MKNNNIYTVFFVAILCVACAGLMAYVNNTSYEDILLNMEAARKKAALEALDMVGETTYSTKRAERDALAAMYDEFLQEESLGELTILECIKGPKMGAFVTEVSGPLRNGPMRAYLAFSDEKAKTAIGFRVFEHAETGGLGAKIEDKKFVDQFNNLQLHNDTDVPGISIVKGSASGKNEVQGISGATATMINLGKNINATITSVRAGGIDLSKMESILFYDFSKPEEPEGNRNTKWSLQGMTKPTIAYPDNIKPEQEKLMRKKDWRPPVFWVTKGAKNVAKGKPVISNKTPMGTGKLTAVTDGKIACDTLEKVFMLTDDAAEGYGDDEIPSVTVDLGKEYKVEGVCVWHNYQRPIVYEGVVVLVSTDKDFPNDPAKTKIVYNNDYNDDVELGAGKNELFPASMMGEMVRVGKLGTGRKVRYVRVYTYGVLNDFSSYPAFLEVAVYAQPK
ncbi:MAG: FMN-binding protein [Phycisphaerales bacterium]|jgi:Na+-translocating ferredoxin:NAD+ oxidoreductase RnfG subunit|nr:FMN-binding protein [Phycisphaerales bacterium]MBT7170953.1 FMN-binding protein [Phycisphaerales bacterium]